MNAVAPIGHNRPPVPTPEEISADMRERFDPLIRRRDELFQSAATFPAAIDTTDPEAAEEVAKNMGDLIKLLAALVKNAESTRVAEKEPYLSGTRAIDGFFNTELIDRVKKVGSPLRQAYDGFMSWKETRERLRRQEAARLAQEEANRKLREAREEEARLREEARQREEAERRRLEQEAQERAAAQAFANPNAEPAPEPEKIEDEPPPAPVAPKLQEAVQADEEARKLHEAAQAKPADLARTRGALGSLGTRVTRWACDVTDRDILDLEALRPYFTDDELAKAARAWMKAHPRQTNLRGAHIREVTTSQVR